MADCRSLSIANLRVVDVGVGLAAALVSRFLRQLGATVVRIEPAGGDPFYDVYPAYLGWHAGSERAEVTALGSLCAQADICVIGGEDFPGLDWRFQAAALAADNPRLIVLDLGGGDTDGVPAADILAQARSGLAFEHHPDRPLHYAFPAPSYGAALQGMIGILAALHLRARNGTGDVVSTSLELGALMWLAGDWMTAERRSAAFDFNIPRGVRPLVFRCKDGGYIHIVTGTPGSLAKLYTVLGIDLPVDPADRGMPRPSQGLDQYFGPCELYATYVAQHDRAPLLAALWREGIAAEAAHAPGEGWDDAQVRANGIVQTATDGTRRIGLPLGLTYGSDALPAVSQPAASAPLAGVRVVDLGTFVAGPYASRLLADLGADVIKIESPAGDPARAIYKTFHSANAGKRSICVDGKSAGGRALIQNLCASADIIHHNYRPGVVERMGVAASDLDRLRPGTVTLSTFAYGAAGPKAMNSGFDMIMQAFCGHEVRNGGRDNPPLWVRSPLVDYAAGALGAIAMLVALLDRQQSGAAVRTEINLLDCGLWMMSELIQFADGRFAGAATNNRWQTGFGPYACFYQALDCWIAVAARSPACRRTLLRTLGIELSAGDADEDEVGQLIAAQVGAEPGAAVIARLRDAGIWAVRCEENGWAALRAAHASSGQAAGLMSSHDATYGALQSIGQLFHLSLADRTTSRPAGTTPAKGGDADAILAELGYSLPQINELRSTGVIC